MCVKDYFVMFFRITTRENLKNIKLSRTPRVQWTLIKLSTFDGMSMFCYESNKVDFFTFKSPSLKSETLVYGNHKSSQ